jgi:ketol-acid reductoisomerase
MHRPKNLHESGVNVVVGLRKPFNEASQAEWDRVIAAGIQPMTVAEAAGRVILSRSFFPMKPRPKYIEKKLPVFDGRKSTGVLPWLQHSFWPNRSSANVDVFMIAPKSPGHLVRSEYVKGAECLP